MRKSLRGINHHRTSKALRQGITLFLGMALLTCGCSDSSEKKASSVSAKQICDSALNSQARAALKRLSKTKELTELSGENEIGEPNKFSASRAVKHLHDETGKRSKCSIYEGDSDFPLMDIQFLAAQDYPNTAKKTASKLVYFQLGSFAAVGKNGADLYFKCATKGARDSFIGNTPYIKAEMFSLSLGARDPRDRMVILNSISRAVASAAGCAAEADLPSNVPAASED